MKKPLLLLALIITFNSQSQTGFNKAYHSKNERPNKFLVAINGSLYFTTQGYDFYDYGNCYLYKHNTSGTLQFRKSVPGANGLCIKTLDNMLLATSRTVICDVVMPTQVNLLQKIDNAGAVVFTATNAVVSGDNAKAVVQQSDSSFFSFTDSLMFKHSKTGAFVSRVNLGINNISSAILLQNGNILLSAMQANTNILIEINTSGSIVSTGTFPVALTKMTFYGNQKIMGLGSDGNFYKVSNTHHLISSSSFSGPASDFTMYHDSIYSIYSSAALSARYLAADSSFVPFTTSNTLTDKIEQFAITTNNGYIAVLSNGIPKTSWSFPEHYFATLNTFAKTGSNNFSHDIALSSVEVDSSYTNCQPAFPTTSKVCSAYLRPKIKIKNKGSQVVSRFKLNSFDMSGVSCGGWFYQEEFSGFVLLPGDSLALTASTFARKYLDLVHTPTVAANYCFYTTLPNDETDKTLADNEICKSFNMLATALTEQSYDLSKEILIYPNPVQNGLTIESTLEISQLEIHNMLGALVKSKTNTGTSAQLSMENLPKGIYFVKLQTEKGTLTKKVVKE